MTSPKGIAGVFDRAADTYDNVDVPWFRPIAKGLADELAVAPGERVLDVGCGRGAALGPFAEAAGPTGRVLGIDLAPRMVERTAEDFRAVPQVEVRVADASAPGLPASSFDVIGSSLVLFFLPDPAAALRTWTDLLVDGGRLGVTTFGPQDERWKEVDEVFTPYLPPAVLDTRTSERRGPFASDDGVEELFRGAGLTDVRTTHQSVDAVFRNAEQMVEFTWSHGQRAMWEAVPEGERPVVRERVLEVLSGFADETGGFTFGQQVRRTLGRRPAA